MKIDSIDKSIYELLSGSFFKIPRFQRPYAWDKENVDEFWGDAVVEGNGDYFIGSIVTYNDGDSRAIVDGQQRITTIILLLCALRDAFNSADLKNEAQGIQALIERKDIDNKLRYVLRTETSYPFFQEHILRPGDPEGLPVAEGPEEAALRQAFDLLTEKVSTVVQAAEGNASLNKTKKQRKIEKDLKSIRDGILALNLISVELDNEDDAYIIFETLNTRGKDLTPGQLVKNHFTKHIKQDNKDVDFVRDNWQELCRILESSRADIDVDSFLLHYWLSKHDYVPQKKLFKSFKKSVTKAKAKAVLSELIEEAPTYRTIFEPAYRQSWNPEEGSIRGALDGLCTFHVRQPTPVVLAVLRAYWAKDLSRTNAERALTMIERFHFVFTAVASKSSSGGISKMYASLAQRLTSASKTDKPTIVNELRKKLQDRWPDYAEFEAGFLALRLSEAYTKNRRLVRYILGRMDQAVRKPPVNMGEMTIEHLASQANTDGVDSEHVAMVGNLCLVTKMANEKNLRDQDPAAKVAILKRESPPHLDDFYTGAGDWNNAAIEARTRALADVAFNVVWRK